MMRYHTLVSTSRTRLPCPVTVDDACDEAEAAFLAADWQNDTTPNVYPIPDGRWVVSDGFQTTKVRILSAE